MGYFKETVRGVSWLGALRGTTRLVSFGRIAILARILLPAQFGVYGIIVLVISFLEVFLETGINIFLIQGEGELGDYLDTAYVISIIRGFFIGLVMIMAASFIGSFFGTPQVVELIYLASLVPIIRGFINPSVVKYQKELQFKNYFLFNFATFALEAVVVIVVALLTRSAASLVWGLIAGGLLELVLSFILFSPKPRLRFNKKKAKSVIKRGKWVTLSGIFHYFFGNTDDVVVGKLLSTASLGVYQMAYKLSSLPISEVVDVVGRVTFPIYSKIADNPKRAKEAFYKTILSVTLLVSVMAAAIYLFAVPIVGIVLGPGWEEVVPVLRVLALYGVFYGITRTTSSLFFALKRQEYVSIVTGVSIFGLGVTIIPLTIKYGVLGAGMSSVIGSALGLPVAYFLVLKIFRELKV